jgi:hypothetical protein
MDDYVEFTYRNVKKLAVARHCHNRQASESRHGRIKGLERGEGKHVEPQHSMPNQARP